MKSMERRKKLVDWLEKDGVLSLTEMVAHFGVSKMTIHRDLDRLAQNHALKRIHGGATRVEPASVQQHDNSFDRLSQLKCLICNRPPSQQLLYIMTFKNGGQKVACCPHCGISAHLTLGDQIVTALTADFLSGRLHSAQHSFYIMEAVVAYCCKPSILTFDNEEMALRFMRGFGGKIGRFNEALAFLKKDISLHDPGGCPHCT